MFNTLKWNPMQVTLKKRFSISSTRSTLLIIGAAVCAVMLGSAACLAQEKGKAAPDSANRSQQFDVEKRKKEHRIFLDKIEILGKIEKPQTAFIIQGKDPTVDDIEIDRSFFHEIFRPVERDKLRKRIERGKRSRRK